MREGSASRCKGFEIDPSDLKVRERIGEGALCDVWVGDCSSRNCKVAVKKMRAEYHPENSGNKAKLVNELELLSTDLKHPNIVAFYGMCLFREARVLGLVFEFMGGGTLENYFDSRSSEGKLHSVAVAQSVSWSLQLFGVLEFLHSKEFPIIHRDLKPSNLLLSADCKTIKVQNFGMSKTVNIGETILADEPCNMEITTDRNLLRLPSTNRYTGTARYMAPEISTESSDYTTAADVYSAALIMWFILEGERPWEKHHGQVASKLSKKGSRPPVHTDGKKYPKKMAELICKCWDHVPARRPTASTAIEILEQIRDASHRSVGCLPFTRSVSSNDEKNQGGARSKRKLPMLF